jgi:hypothetical protein
MATASNTIYSILHMPAVDCNFLLCSARNQEELDMKCRGAAGTFVKDRQVVLTRNLQEAERSLAIDKNADENAVRVRRSINDLLREKLDANAVLYQIYGGTANVDIMTGFFDASRKAWEMTLPDVFGALEHSIHGSFSFADEIVRFIDFSSLETWSSDVSSYLQASVDLHLISFLVRIVGHLRRSSGRI